ncbi:phosphoribosylamine--glycine ligase [Eubacteriales bacterium OttesenSCG-928-M02]|nr:phosphoribosylamine--glycine ligase [Eubacteriales bacterium OttesenSCG-928-M02]
MKILVIGGGGREHAIVRQLYAEGGHEIYCAPGNGGISQIANCVDIVAIDKKGMVEFAQKEGMDLVVVAPDDPLSIGMVDAMEEVGIKAFGPRQDAAQIEASKAFAKDLMKKYGIPTAQYEVFSDPDAAKDYIEIQGAPIVVKADGLALGKGVFVCDTVAEALSAVDEIMVKGNFGLSGRRVVVEEMLSGPEVSLLCFCDGTHAIPMPPSQDHKRAYDGDEGPNTGGMGAFAPTPTFTPELEKRTMEEIVNPTMEAMEKEGCPFHGVLYVGLMLTEDGPKVIEYNSRFGDPEAQAVLPLLKTPLSKVMLATIDGDLSKMEIMFSDGAVACIVLASGGYPGKYETGKEITGLRDALEEGAILYHSGTKLEDGKFYTAGGRVLGVTAMGDTLAEAIEKGYGFVEKIDFEGKHYRKDIGVKGK